MRNPDDANPGGPTNTPDPDPAWLIGPGDSAYPLGEMFQIGREPERYNNLEIRDRRVSSVHAVILRLHDGRYWITDWKSHNGTCVNGERIVGPHRLVSGTRIAIGSHQFVFQDSTSGADPTPDGTSQHDGLVTEPMSDTVHMSVRWLVVFDLVKATSMTESMPEEEAHKVKEQWMREAGEQLRQNGGRVNKYLGDGVFGYWPDGNGVNDRVAQALVAFRSWQQSHTLPFRIVVHRGQVCSSPAKVPTEESLTGRAVDLLFRLEKVAGDNGWPRVMTDPVRAALPVSSTVRELGTKEVKGIPGEFRLFEF